MIWIHLRTAFRLFQKQKLTAVINIIGLGIGLAFFSLLVSYVRDDLTFDKFHKKAAQTYILTSEFRDRFLCGVHHFIAEMLESEFPEVPPGSTVRYAIHSQVVRKEDRLAVKNFAFTDQEFFDLFSFEMNKGNPSLALSDPHNVVITASTAQVLFSGVEPLGRTLSIRIGDNFRDFVVSGIIDDPPGNSSLSFDGLLHYSHVFESYQIDKNNNDFVTLPIFTTTFLYLPDSRKAESLKAKLPAFNHRLYDAMWERVDIKPPKQGFDLLRFPDYHLSDISSFTFVSPGDSAFSWMLAGIAFLILILAFVNSVNLTLAQSSNRLKEIGVRKVIGARKSQLIVQLSTESLLTGFLSMVLGLSTTFLLLKPFNTLTGKHIPEKALFSSPAIGIVLAAVLFVCFLLGLIPALTLSQSKTADVIRGRFLKLKKSRLSLILFIFQFAVSIFFVIGTLVITHQVHYMASKNLGYDPSHILLVETQVPGERAAEGESLFHLFRSKLQTDGRVLAVSADSGTVGTPHGSITRRYDKDGVEHTAEFFMVGADYFKTLNVPLIKGRDFSSDRMTDIQEGIVINEAFVQDFELEDPVGHHISDFAVDKLPPQYTFDPLIIGVVKDFFVFSLRHQLVPMAFAQNGFAPIQRFRNILVKVKQGKETEVLKRLENIWNQIRPDLPFSYRFLEDALAREYNQEKNWSRIAGWSAGFALLIAAMGLFGLTAVTVMRRTKETGIRKVLGASMADILLLFFRESLKWVLLSNILAFPIAFIAARKWLEQFAYRIDIGIWMFVTAALLSLLTAGLTISWYAVRAALSNPVDSLRYE
ncbi:MAG: ABC transporter permease [Candidatus Aminicenantes bacterium]|nr:ABC transporter permease [Candidatus Aminicenantes bacterium]